MTLRCSLVILLALAAASACHEPEPTSPVVGLTQPIDTPQPPDLGNYADRDITIHIYATGNLRQYCVGSDPFFHYDSDLTTPEDQQRLLALVACMMTGPLKDKRIVLTGRADPRGTVPFNDALGLERANRVKAFLVGHGVPTDRVATASAGKSGADPESSKWRTDRRVDIDVLR
jgi:outer membrane protein OmpA-like peptidoglycan-associated protein